MRKSLFCFGFGYCARELARQLERDGADAWQIAGSQRSEEATAALEADGYGVTLFSREAPGTPASLLAGVTHLLISIPPDADGDPVLDLLGPALVDSESLEWVGYLSTTGVYGNRDGGLVDEESQLAPTSARAQRRVFAEQGWLLLAERWGLPVQIFRLAGIYGPGRNLLESLKRGEARRIDRPGQLFSRIHVEDIAQVLRASMARPQSGQVYNLADDAPEEPAKVTAFAAELMGVEPPPLVPFEEAELSAMAETFWRDNKRVSNQRIKEELGVALRYPDYRAGLKALAAGT